MGRAVGTDIILQPIHRLKQHKQHTHEKKQNKKKQENKSISSHGGKNTKTWDNPQFTSVLLCYNISDICESGGMYCTFLVLWGFFILEDFFMSTSVVFTHPGCVRSEEKISKSRRYSAYFHKLIMHLFWSTILTVLQ